MEKKWIGVLIVIVGILGSIVYSFGTGGIYSNSSNESDSQEIFLTVTVIDDKVPENLSRDYTNIKGSPSSVGIYRHGVHPKLSYLHRFEKIDTLDLKRAGENHYMFDGRIQEGDMDNLYVGYPNPPILSTYTLAHVEENGQRVVVHHWEYEGPLPS